MGAAACLHALIFCFLRPIARAVAPAATAGMRRDLIHRRIVDLLVPACSAASRRLKVVMCPVERVGPRCARLGCKVFNRGGHQDARGSLRTPGFLFCGSLPRASCPRSSGGVDCPDGADPGRLSGRARSLFRNPSDEAARAWWTSEGYAPPAHPPVPLATVHKARLQWLDATDTMLARAALSCSTTATPASKSAPTRRGVGTPSGQSAACRRLVVSLPVRPTCPSAHKSLRGTAKAGRWHIRIGTPRPKKRGSP